MSEVARHVEEERPAQPGSGLDIDLILLSESGERFFVAVNNGRLTPLRLVGHRSDSLRESLPELVQRLTKEQLDADVEYLGLLTSELDSRQPRLCVSAALRDSSTLGSQQRAFSLADIRARRDDVAHLDLYEQAFRWHRACRVAGSLPQRIQRAFDRSLRYLDNHLSVEEGRWGWNLYMDGTSLGLLSTAEGVLAHVHADATGEFVDRPVETLEAMQNPDGGWQVRRSLVGAHSDMSITESTCAVLWALHGVGRSASDHSVSRGLAWLESVQRLDGGWPSADTIPGERESEPQVFPTTCAVRVLARFGRSDVAAKGVAWLRAAQNEDGGWGVRVPSAGAPAPSSPAYAGYAVIALLKAGVAPADPAIERACAYLRSQFDPEKEEPWESTAHISLVNPVTSARLEFRHFGTPWVLAALSSAGADLSDPVVLEGVDKLLRLQEPDGAWRCQLTPGARVMWETHDALYALRTIMDRTVGNLEPVALDRYRTAERAELQRVTVGLMSGAEPAVERASGGGWFQKAWLAVLTVVVTVITLVQFGVFQDLQSKSVASKLWAGLATVLVPIIVTMVPSIATEEYRGWRARRTRRRGT